MENGTEYYQEVFDTSLNEFIAEVDGEELQRLYCGEVQQTDLTRSEFFVKVNHRNVRYCNLLKRWFIWDGYRWKVDNKNEIIKIGKSTIRKLYLQVNNLDSYDDNLVIRLSLLWL